MKSTTLKALTVLAVLATALSAFAQGPEPAPRGGGPGEGPREGGQPSLACIPDMTAEQLETIQELRDEFHEANEDLRDQLREAREEFRELLRDADPDLGAVRAAKDRLDDLETEMLLAGLEHRGEIRDVLTAEQQVFFDELHHGRPGGRGGRPGMGTGGPEGHGPEGR